ncbi:SMI1/KNR4 family protein [Kitasatospora sp. SolWspMP-SS2h]|uniref:SMI1/KNR4 family protein n=1 Tax=Kitasatospora sp. SolWspMP-SS2h TaxID=1305729 RepID=UPI000DB9E1A0|nr:SMI1/KNR4 family protein [Kitasatospora sp. SolWspMP-SS2h]
MLTESEVRAFEDRFAIELPEDYREFLLTVGDGGAGVCPLLRPWYPPDEHEPYPGFLATPFPHGREFRLAGPVDETEELVAGTIVVGYDGFDPVKCWYRLVVTGAQAGRVWQDRLEQEGVLKPGPRFVVWYRHRQLTAGPD